MGEVKKVPKLRFPEYNSTLACIELGRCCTINPRNTELPESFIYVDLESVNDGILTKLDRIKKVDAPSRAQRLLKNNDILYQTVRPYQKNNFFFDSEQTNFVASTGYAQIRTKENPRYIYQYFHTNQFVNKVLLRCTGTSYPSINSSDLSQIEINLPSIPEQTKIANFLTAVDAKIANLNEEKSLLENYKKGVMQKLFSQELRFKQDDGSDFPEWEEKMFGEVLTIGSGRDYKHLSEGVIPVYGTGGLMTSVDDFLYEGKSVCIGRKGTIDKPMFLEGKFWTVDTLFYTHSFEGVVPKFLYFVFLGINWQKYNEASGVPSLSKRTIESIKFECPSIGEQTKIANFLTSIEEKINTVTEAMEKAQEWKKGLLQQLFV